MRKAIYITVHEEIVNDAEALLKKVSTSVYLAMKMEREESMKVLGKLKLEMSYTGDDFMRNEVTVRITYDTVKVPRICFR